MSSTNATNDVALATACNLTRERVQSLRYEELVALIKTPGVIEASKRFLERVMLRFQTESSQAPTTSQAPATTQAPTNINTRHFLAALLITHHPGNVLDILNDPEHVLVAAASLAVTGFYRILESALAGGLDSVDPEVAQAFPAQLLSYLEIFQTWRATDAPRLTRRIKRALVAIYAAEAQMQEGDAAVLQIMAQQIDRLRAKLRSHAGEEELARFDEERAAGTLDTGHDTSPDTRMGLSPGIVDSEQLTHEILLNPEFRLADPSETDEQRVFRAAFWNRIIGQLEASDFYGMVRVLEEIRTGLLELFPDEGGSIRAAIDVARVTGAATGAQSWQESVGLVSGVMDIIFRVQSPSRETARAEAWGVLSGAMRLAEASDQARLFSDALKFLLKCVNEMRIDEANERIERIKPVLLIEGVKYEQGKFQDKVDSGALTTERTKAWLKQTLEDMAVDLRTVAEGGPLSSLQVHCAGMVTIATGRESLTRDSCPETLVMDVQHLNGLRLEFECLVTVAAMMTTTRRYIVASGDIGDLEIVREVSDTLSAFKIAPTEAYVGTIAEKLQQSSLSEARRGILVHLLEENTDPSDPVRLIFARGIRSFVLSLLNEDTAVDIGCLSSVAVLMPRIEGMAETLKKLARLNNAVHASLYQRLCREAAAELLAVE